MVPPESSRKTIVIYSTDADLSKSLKFYFENHYQVLLASKADQVEDFLTNHPVHLVLIDGAVQQHPILSLVQSIFKTNPGLPILLLWSGSVVTPEIEKSIHPLVDTIIYKPFPLETVVTRVDSLLRPS